MYLKILASIVSVYLVVMCAYVVSHTFAAGINATITTGIFVPDEPVNLAVSIGDQQVSLSWSQPFSDGGSPISDYVIEYKLTSGGVWSTVIDGVSTSTSVIVLGLTNDTSYDFRVSAINGVGQGLVSDSVTATPGAPAQVLVLSFSDLTVSDIATAVRITNEGATAYEYQYTWCITNAETNLCGGGNDLFSATAAKLIQAGENWDTNLNSTVSASGNYWFHVTVSFGSDSSYASQSFTAEDVASSGGSGGSSSGSRRSSSRNACVGADLNRDNIVTIVDFSIMLVFFNTAAPFKNVCADINRDNSITIVDFSIMLSQWGKKPIPYRL